MLATRVEEASLLERQSSIGLAFVLKGKQHNFEGGFSL
jgi:hypothetical protein